MRVKRSINEVVEVHLRVLNTLQQSGTREALQLTKAINNSLVLMFGDSYDRTFVHLTLFSLLTTYATPAVLVVSQLNHISAHK